MYEAVRNEDGKCVAIRQEGVGTFPRALDNGDYQKFLAWQDAQPEGSKLDVSDQPVQKRRSKTARQIYDQLAALPAGKREQIMGRVICWVIHCNPRLVRIFDDIAAIQSDEAVP